MKYKFRLAFVATISLLLIGCSNDLKENAKMEVIPTAEGGVWDGDVFVVKKSTPLAFQFKGEPDFITFYSGEDGHEYSKKDLVMSPPETLTSEMTFEVKPQYGVMANTLSVYLSTSFKGLVGNDKPVDSVAVQTHEWIDVTAQCNLPTNSKLVSVNIPMDDYLGKDVTLAFHYKTDQNAKAQPRWEITNLKIVNTDKKTSQVSELPAIQFGFTPLDMYVKGKKAYESGAKGTNTEGIWNIASVGEQDKPLIYIHSSKVGSVMNDDWLISVPMKINARTNDKGQSIKNIGGYLREYYYTYDNVGDYTLTFVATNGNYEKVSKVVREVNIRVVD